MIWLLSLMSFICSWVLGVEVYTVRTEEQWKRWTYPEDLVQFTDEGYLKLRRFSKLVNPIEDAGRFEHEDGIVRAGSNQGDAELIVDGDPRTWWKPRQEDGLDKWWIDIDLGRVVLVSKIRLRFPDTTGARPFRYFSVWASPGIHVMVSPKNVRYSLVGATVGANRDTLVEYDLATYSPSPSTAQYLNTSDRLPFAPVRYVRFVSEGKNEDAALAELEMEAIGYNVALNAQERGGSIESSKRTRGAESLIDGSLETGWGMEWSPEQTWLAAGTWWKLDLGSVFFVDRIVFIPNDRNYTPYFYWWDPGRSGKWEGLVFFTSDGTPSGAVGGAERVEGNFKYELLSYIDNRPLPRRWVFDLSFPTRQVRYIFWHLTNWSNFRQWLQALEIFVYSAEGYPSEVELTSDWIDFEEPKSFTSILWDAELPPGTHIEVKTRTGNTLEKVAHYFTRTGLEIPEEKWRKLPPVARGEVRYETRVGADWSEWSQAYKLSGQGFLSPSPRRYVQVKVLLCSDDPEVAPVLRSLSIVYNPSLIKGGIFGRVLPREAHLDSLEAFRYVLWPKYNLGDLGFDRVIIRVHSEVREVSVRVGSKEVQVTSRLCGDSLVVELPRRVTGDSVEVSFRTRVFRNPSVFSARVENSRRPGIWQDVVPSEADADKVFVPSVYCEGRLIRDVWVEPSVMTPNGDDGGESLKVRFHLVRTSKEPEVGIYALDGRLVRKLRCWREGVRYKSEWDGRDEGGNLVPPGVYILRMGVDSDAGREEVSRPVCVVY